MRDIKKIFKRVWRESNGFNKIANIPLAILFCHFLESGKSRLLIRMDSSVSIRLLPIISSYYLAHAYYLHGAYEKARVHLERVLTIHPHHADATYLLCDIDNMQGKKADAWERITRLTKNSGRLKTWLVMANLVDNKNDFYRLYTTWRIAIESKKVVPFHLEVNGYIATGALRAKLYDKALALWEDFISNIITQENISRNKSSHSNFTRGKAERALLDIKKVLDLNDIEFFLVSGTLLGCIREGHLLAHDKDADIGVWDDYRPDDLIIPIRTSGLFYIQPSRSPHVIRVKHVNGTAIDVFFHYREKNDYWHGGVKLKWSNTPFELTKHRFLSESFKIPKNFDLYLTENYGNWRVPRKIFDSSMDTTNATIINNNELRISLYKKLAEARLNKSEHIIQACLLNLSKIPLKTNSFK